MAKERVFRLRFIAVATAIAVMCAVFGTLSKSATASQGGAASTAALLTQANKIVKQAESPLDKWTAPGPSVAAAAVKGKVVAYIPDAPNIPYTQAVYAGFQQAAKVAGVTPLFLSNDSTPSGWEQNISEAISHHVAAIVLQGIPSGLISEGVSRANKAHIPVIETSDEDVSYPLQKGIAGQVQYPVKQVGTVMAAYALAASKGKLDAAVITSSDTSAAKPLLAGIRAETAKCGSSCKISVDDVPVADWATKLPQLVSSILQSNPNINWIIPLYDSELPYIIPAVTAAHKTSSVHIVSFNATPGIMKYLANKQVLSGDVGNPEAWFGFEFMDQAIRVMTGHKALPTTREYDPIRLFTTGNFTTKTLNEPQAKWYGPADFAAGYKRLWKK